MRFKLSKDNKLIGIDTGRANTVADSEQSINELKKDREGELKWLPNPRSFDGTLMDENGVFFGIPDDVTRYDKYVIYQAAGLPTSKYQVYLYNVNEIGIASAAVVMGSPVAEIENDDPTYMVKKLVKSVDSEGVSIYRMYAVECKTGTEKTFVITEDSGIFEYVTMKLPSPFAEDITEAQKIKPGDVVRISASAGTCKSALEYRL